MSIHWIKHDGIEMPVPANAQVLVRHRGGGGITGAPAGNISGWKHMGAPWDVVEFSCNPEELIAKFCRPDDAP